MKKINKEKVYCCDCVNYNVSYHGNCKKSFIVKYHDTPYQHQTIWSSFISMNKNNDCKFYQFDENKSLYQPNLWKEIKSIFRKKK